jgi:glycosyltransferase involved in cell wall biosynthesis
MRAIAPPYTDASEQPLATPGIHVPPAEGVAVFPLIEQNPYQRLLYAHFAAQGFGIVDDVDFKLRSLWKARGRVRFLHFHWPQNYYSWWRRPEFLRSALSWLKLPLFAVRMTAARMLGYRIVWTIHEVAPHERRGRGIDRVGSTILARGAHVLIAHDRGTVRRAHEQLGVPEERIDVIRHGSYVDVYPAGRPRGEVRRALGIPENAFVFLSFGHIRAYKDVDVLLAAFSRCTLPDARLVVAGLPLDAGSERVVHETAERDPRVSALLEFVPDDAVSELFEASDVAVLARGDGGTSGALVLALSLGIPVVASANPDYVELVGEAGWTFPAGDAEALARTLEEAACSRDQFAARSAAARDQAASLDWRVIAAETGAALRRWSP